MATTIAMAHSTIAAATATALIVTWLAATLASRMRPRVRHGKNPPLPPGPPPLPLVGNVRDLPPADSHPWEFWLRHKDLYGPISSVSAFGSNLVIVHDPEIAMELFEARGARYSSRPWLTFASDMCGYSNGTVMLPSGHRNRAHRKYMHATIGAKAAVAQHAEHQMTEIRRFLLRAMEQPDELLEHIKTEAGGIIVKIAYGYTIEPHGPDPLVKLVQKSMDQFAVATTPGRWLVDLLPFLKYMPDFLPGTGFKAHAREFKDVITHVVNDPVEFVKRQMAAAGEGGYYKSYVSNLYERVGGTEDVTAEDEENVKWSAMALYTGGADTTVSVIHFFFLNMLLHPEIQLRAQEELDRVVGHHRLPTLQDRDSLPYIDAIVKETYRWQPVAPMGVPHAATEDDTFDGYLIPKDAVIMANIWWFTHDPRVYPDPMTFNPDRWLVADEDLPADPRNFIFGFGRRICPGKMLADQSVFLTIACALAVFDMAMPVDANTGREIEPEVEFAGGDLSKLKKPFRAVITPRTAEHGDLIKSVEEEYPWEEGSARLMAEMGL